MSIAELIKLLKTIRPDMKVDPSTTVNQLVLFAQFVDREGLKHE